MKLEAKKCNKCDETKPIVDFAWKNKIQGKLQDYCRQCRRIIDRNYWFDNRKRISSKKNLNSVIRRKENHAVIIKIKEETPCTDCASYYPHYVMDFDHLRDKKFDIANSYDYSLESLLTEISKCDLVCSNCHRIRTFCRKNLTGKQV